MNNRGALFATLTMIIMIIFVISINARKTQILEETKIVETGKIPDIAIYFSIEEETMKFFIEKSMEYASFNALKKMGEEGGILKEQKCEKVNEYVIWKDDCYFSDNLEENFFSRFEEFFNNYLKEYGASKVNTDWEIDENNKFVIEADGIIELEYKGVKYGFEPDIKSVLDYDFSYYTEILRKAKECLRDEELKGITRNNLFEKCRNDKDFKWGVKVEDKFVLFSVSKPYKNLGDVSVKFAIPHNQ